MALQSYEDRLSLNQVEILNVSCEDEGESSLNISLEEVLVVDAVNNTAIIGDKIGKVFRS